MQVLNCKQHCAVELASHISRNEPFKDFLPSHFNYLQFSYYNSESVHPPSSNTRFLLSLSQLSVRGAKAG